MSENEECCENKWNEKKMRSTSVFLEGSYQRPAVVNLRFSEREIRGTQWGFTRKVEGRIIQNLKGLLLH